MPPMNQVLSSMPQRIANDERRRGHYTYEGGPGAL